MILSCLAGPLGHLDTLNTKNPSTTFDYIGKNRMLQKSEEEEQELSKSYSYRRG